MLRSSSLDFSLVSLALRRFSSTSQIATMLECIAAWSLSLSPLPPMPQPIHATFTRSLGLLDLSSSAQVIRPATQNPTPARAEPLRKSRRLVRRVIWTAPESEGDCGRGETHALLAADVKSHYLPRSRN